MSNTYRHLPQEQKSPTYYNSIIAGSSCYHGNSLKCLFRGSMTVVAQYLVVVAMSFRGYQGEANPQVEHKVPGAEKGAQMMQLAQVQLAQIVSSAGSQALT